MESAIRFLHIHKGKSGFLFGPRGTGKSTWLRQTWPEAQIIDLLEPDVYQRYLARPQHLREVVEGSNQSVFVIDEVQKIPQLLSLVHALIEENKGRRFILTGSSTRKLKREGVDMLAGRAILYKMHPFMAAEMGDQFSLQRALRFGMVPLINQSDTPALEMRTYLALYVKEEVQMEGLVRHLDAFSRFLEAISFSQGSVLNYANIARECHTQSKSVENYVTILEDLLLSFKVPVFSKKAKRHLISKPKFYYFDAGVYHGLRPKGPLDAPEECLGIALETLVAQHLRAWLDYSSEAGRLFFWRTKAGLEVDFVVYGEIGFYAIEVKHTAYILPKDLKGLRAFQTDYPQAHCMILYQGDDVMKKQGIMCYPVEAFLKGMLPNKQLPLQG